MTDALQWGSILFIPGVTILLVIGKVSFDLWRVFYWKFFPRVVRRFAERRLEAALSNTSSAEKRIVSEQLRERFDAATALAAEDRSRSAALESDILYLLNELSTVPTQEPRLNDVCMHYRRALREPETVEVWEQVADFVMPDGSGNYHDELTGIIPNAKREAAIRKCVRRLEAIVRAM